MDRAPAIPISVLVASQRWSREAVGIIVAHSMESFSKFESKLQIDTAHVAMQEKCVFSDVSESNNRETLLEHPCLKAKQDDVKWCVQHWRLCDLVFWPISSFLSLSSLHRKSKRLNCLTCIYITNWICFQNMWVIADTRHFCDFLEGTQDPARRGGCGECWCYWWVPLPPF